MQDILFVRSQLVVEASDVQSCARDGLIHGLVENFGTHVERLITAFLHVLKGSEPRLLPYHDRILLSGALQVSLRWGNFLSLLDGGLP